MQWVIHKGRKKNHENSKENGWKEGSDGNGKGGGKGHGYDKITYCTQKYHNEIHYVSNICQ